MQSPDVRTGRYTLVAQMHDGDAAELFRARVDGVCGFEKFIMLKRLPPELAQDEAARRRFIRQAVICSKLCHHNVVGVYDFYQEGGGFYLAMELVDGTSLATLLSHQRHAQQAFSLTATLSIVLQLLDALDYIHKARDPISYARLELVHRDLRPDNVMVDRSSVTKLIGFGHCHVEGNEDEERIDPPSRYASPESLEGERPTTASDIFSAGALLFEMLTLKPLIPESATSLEEIRRAHQDVDTRLELVPSAFQAIRPILKRALAGDPTDRYPSACVMSRDLRTHQWPVTGVLSPDQVIREAVESARQWDEDRRTVDPVGQEEEATEDDITPELTSDLTPAEEEM